MMASGDKRCFGRKLAGLGDLHAAATSLEEFLGIHGDPNLYDGEIVAPVCGASDLIADRVNVLSDELMFAKAVQMDDGQHVGFDDFHFLVSPSPSLAREYRTTAFPIQKLNSARIRLRSSACCK